MKSLALELLFQRSQYVYCTLLQQNTDYYEWESQLGFDILHSLTTTSNRRLRSMISYLSNTDFKIIKNNAITTKISMAYDDFSLYELLSFIDKLYNESNVIRREFTVSKNWLKLSFYVYSNMYSYGIPRDAFESLGLKNICDRIQTLEKIPAGEIGLMKNQDSSKKKVEIFTCDACHNSYYEAKYLKEITSSLGKKFNLCGNCTSTRKCGICEYTEPAFLVRSAVSINEETGKNKPFIACAKCIKHNFIRCGNCGNFYDIKEDFCPCRIPAEFKPFISAHNADVLDFYQKDSYCKELFGIEIEVGTLNKNRKLYNEIANYTKEIVKRDAILKYDSSIDWINKNEGIENDYKGFEVVTRPMIYKNSMRFLKNFCKNKHPLIRSWEVGTCGLHIHVSKECLSPFEIGKILLFINSKANRKFVEMIAKREDKRFAKFLTKKILDYKKSTPGPNGIPREHYEAINTSKQFTIEFRIFRGTLNIQTVLSYLQFVKSLIDFIKITPKANLMYKHYVGYLFSTEKSAFRELKERIKLENMKEIEEKNEI